MDARRDNRHDLGSSGTLVLLTPDRIGSRMAGPALRMIGLARALSNHPDLSPSPRIKIFSTQDLESPWSGPPAAAFESAHIEGLKSAHLGRLDLAHAEDDRALAPILESLSPTDGVLVQGMLLERFPSLTRTRARVIVDLYDPIVFEAPFTNGGRCRDARAYTQNRILSETARQLAHGDFFLVHSERQRDFLLGLLVGLGGLDAETIATGRPGDLFGIVPNGIEEGTGGERGSGKGPDRGFWDAKSGIGTQDPIIFWGGGLWDWLDPLRLLDATHLLKSSDSRLHVVLPGIGSPNPEVPAPENLEKVRNWIDRHEAHSWVHLIEWLPLEQWTSALKACDLVVTLAGDTYENHLAFRSRIGDFIAAGVPFLVSGGDATAERTRQWPLAEIARTGSVDELARQIERLLETSTHTAPQHSHGDSAPPDSVCDPSTERPVLDLQIPDAWTWNATTRDLVRFWVSGRKRERLTPLLDLDLVGHYWNRNRPWSSRILRAAGIYSRKGFAALMDRVISRFSRPGHETGGTESG